MKFRKDYGTRRGRQAENEFAYFDCVAGTKFETIELPQLGWRRHLLARRQAKDLFTPEDQEAVERLDGGVGQDQIVLFAAADADNRPIIFKIDRAENCRMVDELKHRESSGNGFPPATPWLQ